MGVIKFNDETFGDGSGASNLSGLSDVAISSPSNNQVLKYDSTSSKWVNGAGGGGGGGSVLAISKSDYDALSTADKNNGTVYMVTTPAHGDQGILSLLHFDSLKDEAGDIIWTPFGLANISDELSKFGNSSLLLDKYNSVGIYSSASDKFDFADNDWTIDAWIYPVAVDRYALFSIAPVNYGDCRLAVDLFYGNGSANEWAGSSGYAWDLVQSDSSQGQGSVSLTTNAWQHIAYVRDGNLLTLYVNGQQAVQNDIGSASIYHGETDVLKIGLWGDNGFGFNGYIDEFCVRNYAAWSAAFSPPSSPYEIYQPESYSIYYMSKKFS